MEIIIIISCIFSLSIWLYAKIIEATESNKEINRKSKIEFSLEEELFRLEYQIQNDEYSRILKQDEKELEEKIKNECL